MEWHVEDCNYKIIVFFMIFFLNFYFLFFIFLNLTIYYN